MRSFHRVIILALSVVLGACAFSSQQPLSPQEKKRVEFEIAQRLYDRAPSDANVVARYAAALRHDNRVKEAETLLLGWIENKYPSATIETEFSNVRLAMGLPGSAEEYARRATQIDPEYGPAYFALAVAYDAQKKYEKGEQSYLTALEHWEEHPELVMVSLALNLASQDRLFEASETLYKAKEIAPMNMDIERNLRIITALQESRNGYMIKPAPRPVTNTDTPETPNEDNTAS